MNMPDGISVDLLFVIQFVELNESYFSFVAKIRTIRAKWLNQQEQLEGINEIQSVRRILTCNFLGTNR